MYSGFYGLSFILPSTHVFIINLGDDVKICLYFSFSYPPLFAVEDTIKDV